MKISTTCKKFSNLGYAFLSSLFLLHQGNAQSRLEGEEQEYQREFIINSSTSLSNAKITCGKWRRVLIEKGARVSSLTINLGHDPRSSLIIQEGVLNDNGTRPVILGSDIIVISIPGQVIEYYLQNLYITTAISDNK